MQPNWVIDDADMSKTSKGMYRYDNESPRNAFVWDLMKNDEINAVFGLIRHAAVIDHYIVFTSSCPSSKVNYLCNQSLLELCPLSTYSLIMIAESIDLFGRIDSHHIPPCSSLSLLLIAFILRRQRDIFPLDLSHFIKVV